MSQLFAQAQTLSLQLSSHSATLSFLNPTTTSQSGPTLLLSSTLTTISKKSMAITPTSSATPCRTRWCLMQKSTTLMASIRQNSAKIGSRQQSAATSQSVASPMARRSSLLPLCVRITKSSSQRTVGPFTIRSTACTATAACSATSIATSDSSTGTTTHRNCTFWKHFIQTPARTKRPNFWTRMSLLRQDYQFSSKFTPSTTPKTPLRPKKPPSASFPRLK